MGLIKLPCGCRVRTFERDLNGGRFDHLCTTHRLANESQDLLLRVHLMALNKQTVTMDQTKGGLLDRIKILCRQLIKG